MQIAFLAPGQGSQRPGMLSPWLSDDAAMEQLDAFNEAADLDLRELGTRAESVTDTAVAQPLIVAASLLSASALGSSVSPSAVAGHSVGELTALAVAGVITPAEAVGLAAVRGRAMAHAAGQQHTGMSAVVGGQWDDVLSAIAASGAQVANVNSATQVVAAGTAAQLRALAGAPPARARVIPLDVSGAFHTSFMASAVAPVRAALTRLAPRDPVIPLVSNVDGQVLSSGQEALERIARQITAPVRWDLCQEQLRGVDALVELAPGGVLTGLAKRCMRGVPAVALTSPDDLSAARALASQGVK